MTLEIGTIEVDANGDATGTGLAFAIFNGALSALSGENRSKVAGGMAPFCTGIAMAIIEHLTEHGVVSVEVTPSNAGLQRNPEDSAPTLAPAETKTLTGSIT